jgi:predicted dehydrogenase
MRQKEPSIIIIGAGGIVQDAHLPAYKKAGYTVAGIYDKDIEKAKKVAADFGIPAVYPDLKQAVAAAGPATIFDIAVPASAIIPVLKKIPAGSAVLLQKPMGETLEQAKAILAICKEKKLPGGINFQLRYAPFILKARELINSGQIGTLCDIEININVLTPWQLWDFLFTLPRMEILYHSIHYLDLVRQLAGEPSSIFARTIKHPDMPQLASVKSMLYMDYGENMRASILTNHCHKFGPKHQHSYIRIEGTRGAIYIRLGLLMDYPKGVPDQFEYISLNDKGEGQWKSVTIIGSWFPDAFAGSMGEMMKALTDKKYKPDNNLADGLKTMQWVEKAYQSNDRRKGI